jgi:hypothetical protein
MKEIKSYRLSMPLVLCVTIEATSFAAAKRQLKKQLAGSTLEQGVELYGGQIGIEDDGPDGDPVVYANEPFNGIGVEDVYHED